MKYKLTADRLNEALNEKNMTAQELSKKSGVNKASISQYRNGSHKPSNTSAGPMGEVLGVNPLWLMGFDVDKYDMANPFAITIDKKYIDLFKGVNKLVSIATQERVNQLFDFVNYMILQQEKEDDQL